MADKGHRHSLNYNKEHKMNGGELQMLPVRSAAGETLSLAYRFLRASGNAPTFLWFCGFKSEMESIKADALAAWAAERGAGCLRFDYSGHGQSGGRFQDGTISRWLDEAAEISSLALSGGPTVFVGSSMGGWIALLLARRLAAQGGSNLKAVTLIAPAWDLTRLMWERAPEEARNALVRDGVYIRPSVYSDEPYEIRKTLLDDGANHFFGQGPVSIHAPVRILHGQRDPDVPWQHSVALMDVLDGEDMRLTPVKDAEHRLSRTQDLALLFATLEEFI
jgi:pimeloyl-ACP methyl ester carboxylesterase